MNKHLQKPKKSDNIELSIGSLAFGGKGVARHYGFVIFVEGAVPGDVVLARITKSKPSYAEARVEKMLEPSSRRIEPRCRHFGICGGCSWQNLAYEEQLKFKQMQVTECLGHIGGISGFIVEPALAAEPLWRYRNKVEFSFVDTEGGTGLGFHLPGQWQKVIDIEDCLLHSAATNEIRNHIRAFVRRSGVAAYDQKSGSGFWRHLVLREGINTGELMVNVVTAPGDFPDSNGFTAELKKLFPQIVSIIWSVNETKASVATGFPFRVLSGRDYFLERICGLDLMVSPPSFLQTNTSMAERLYRKALEYTEIEAGESVLDLFSGIGSIALLLAQKGGSVHGIEIVEDAVRLAGENAALNGIGNTVFTAGKVRAALKELDPGEKPDVIVLDPPRSGASKKEIKRIIELGARRIVYVSCNASTMAGNASQLGEGGYNLIKTAAVDMFPHTPHIEVVAQFNRQ